MKHCPLCDTDTASVVVKPYDVVWGKGEDAVKFRLKDIERMECTTCDGGLNAEQSKKLDAAIHEFLEKRRV